MIGHVGHLNVREKGKVSNIVSNDLISKKKE